MIEKGLGFKLGQDVDFVDTEKGHGLLDIRMIEIHPIPATIG